jgi:hypothetical protein
MNEEKVIRVIPFDGKVENWRMWKVKFTAKATQGGYRGAIEGTIVVPEESKVLDEVKDVDLIKNRLANNNAYTCLCLSCNGVAFGSVEKATTVALPSGDAALAWKNLCSKYEPKTQMSMVALKKELAQCRLESVDTDPDEWINVLEHYRMRIRGINIAKAMSDEDMMIHMLANLPQEYSEFVTTIENDLEQTTITLTLDQMMDRLRNFYRRKFESKSNGKSEVALTATFNGTCFTCGEKGHKSFECTKNGTKYCDYCKKKGHNENDCWSKKKADESESEENHIALVAVMEEDYCEDCAERRNYFLCDSGASTHMINDEMNLLFPKDVNCDILLGNGAKMRATKIGMIVVIVKDTKGAKRIVTLNKVLFVPGLKHNILSVNAMVMNMHVMIVYDKKGAHLVYDDNKMIKLEKYGQSEVYCLMIEKEINKGKTVMMPNDKKIQEMMYDEFMN